MKYLITDPETDHALAAVDLTETAGVARWEIELAASKEKTRLEGEAVLLEGDFLQARLEGADGPRLSFPIHRQASTGVVTVATALGNIRVKPARSGSGLAAGGGRAGARALKSSMPGKVLKLLCKPGDRVESGQPLLVIEAMKMENEIRSPQAGRVEEVAVQAGQSVATGDLLVKIGADA